MRCLILGGTGFIGSHLAGACIDRGLAHLGTWYRTPHPDLHPLDVRDADAVDELIADYQPDVTFLAAGFACPGAAEAFPDECRHVAVTGARVVADAVARRGGSLVLFTSADVFGECPTARREEDQLAPAGELARCHAAAEAAVRDRLPGRHLVIRAGWVFGADGERTRAGRLARRLADGEGVEAATDRHGQPTYAPDLADAALELARRGHTGTVHVAGPDRHTEFAFARLAAHVLGADVDLVAGVPAADLDDAAARPARSWLDRHRLRTLLGPRAVRGTADGFRAVRAAAEPAARAA